MRVCASLPGRRLQNPAVIVPPAEESNLDLRAGRRESLLAVQCGKYRLARILLRPDSRQVARSRAHRFEFRARNGLPRKRLLELLQARRIPGRIDSIGGATVGVLRGSTQTI